ncbi:MAG: hypothetical protein IPF92_11610 [Myxococcales bacterium]|jgi:MYXO-CTERM domain-containing protein|nr:hypothetical protein [Myxococcales bacterium]MBL0198276.1 hypothetical protein [Myxococcales bacterium]HQY62976.1 hypothetical protein [Polyangiaceae bacterium]
MRNLMLSCLAISSLLVSSAASADIPPGPSPTNPSAPARPTPCGTNENAAASSCSGKNVGEACTLASGASGECQALRCTTEAGTTLLACASPAPGADAGTSGPVSSSSNCAVHAPGAHTVGAGGAGLTLLGLAVAVAGRRRRR